MHRKESTTFYKYTYPLGKMGAANSVEQEDMDLKDELEGYGFRHRLLCCCCKPNLHDLSGFRLIETNEMHDVESQDKEDEFYSRPSSSYETASSGEFDVEPHTNRQSLWAQAGNAREDSIHNEQYRKNSTISSIGDY